MKGAGHRKKKECQCTANVNEWETAFYFKKRIINFEGAWANALVTTENKT